MKKILIIALLFSYIAANAQQDTIIVYGKLTNQSTIYNNGVLIIDTVTESSAALEIRSTTRGLLLPRLDSTAMMKLKGIEGMWFYSEHFGLNGYWSNGKFRTARPKTQQFTANPNDTVEIFLCISEISTEFKEGDHWVMKSPMECIDYTYYPDTLGINPDRLNVSFSEKYVYLQSDTARLHPESLGNYIYDGSWMDLGVYYEFGADEKFWIKTNRVCNEYRDNYKLARGATGINVDVRLDPKKTYFINQTEEIQTVFITYY